MSELETISFKVSKKMAADIKRKAGENQSNFIREAIQEKLTRVKDDDGYLKMIISQIAKLDPNAIHGAIADLVYTAKVIFEETKKQNEVLKDIHTKSAGALGYSQELFLLNDGRTNERKLKIQTIVDSAKEINNRFLGGGKNE